MAVRYPLTVVFVIARFEELFTCLDASKTALGISSWGISVRAMDELFDK